MYTYLLHIGSIVQSQWVDVRRRREEKLVIKAADGRLRGRECGQRKEQYSTEANIKKNKIWEGATR